MSKPTDLSVLGSTGLDYNSGYVFEEFIPDLRLPQNLKIYKEMSSNDPVIGSILFCVRQLIKKVNWKVAKAGESRLDKLAAEFLEECLNDMSLPWTDIIDDITSCFEYGWHYAEMIFKIRGGDTKDSKRKSKYNDGLIGLRKISGRSQDSWAGWELDEDNDMGINGMYQYTNKSDKVFLPIDKCVLNRTSSIRNNPEGRSFLRNSYRPWYFKKYIEEIEGIGIERDLAGLPVLKLPEDVDIWDSQNPESIKMKTAAQKMLKSIKRGKSEGCYLPFGWDLELLSSSSSRQFDTNTIINRYDQRIAITLLSDIVMLGGDKVGSFALASTKKSLLASALDSQVKSFASNINSFVIPKLFKMNAKFVGLKVFPYLQPSPVDAPDMKDLAAYIQTLSNIGMPLFPNIDLENHLRQVANLPDASGKEIVTDVKKEDPPGEPGKRPSNN